MTCCLCLQTGRTLTWLEGDLNGNGYFNVIDFSILLGQWGTICFGAELDPFYREEKIPAVISEGFPKGLLPLKQQR